METIPIPYMEGVFLGLAQIYCVLFWRMSCRTTDFSITIIHSHCPDICSQFHSCHSNSRSASCQTQHGSCSFLNVFVLCIEPAFTLPFLLSCILFTQCIVRNFTSGICCWCQQCL